MNFGGVFVEESLTSYQNEIDQLKRKSFLRWLVCFQWLKNELSETREKERFNGNFLSEQRLIIQSELDTAVKY